MDTIIKILERYGTVYMQGLAGTLWLAAITVVLGVGLGMTGYSKIWPLFGAANQLLAGLALMAVACWLGNIGKNNKMFYFPMFFMLIVTLTSLVFTIKAQVVGIMAGGEGVVWCYVRGIIGVRW